MRHWIALVAVAMALSAGRANAQGSIPVDDSYTVSKRYYLYKDQYPEIEWPVLEFEAGQKILSDRLYKKVGERELHLDVFLPADGREKGQGILLVHGGAWRSGNKSNFYALANLLAQRGYVVFLPEYRLAPEAGYPAGLLDINDAMSWVKEGAGEFGVRSDRIAIGGASSGGQMASLVAYTQALDMFKSVAGEDTSANALVDLDGVLDMTTPLALRYENAAGADSVAAKWLGGAMEDVPETWRAASAANYVGSQSPPTLIVSSGEARFTAGREAVLAKLDQEGVRNQCFSFENAPHTFWLFEPYLSQVVQMIDDFLAAELPQTEEGVEH